MARVYGIQKWLEQKNMDKKLIKEIIGNGNLIEIITRMEKWLDPDMVVQILDSCACGGGKEYVKKCEIIGKEIAGKPINERIDHINNISPDSDKIVLNADNTLTVTWNINENGKCKCACSAAVNKGVKVSDLALGNNDTDDRVMPLAYCFCCAGASRRHLQLQLGVALKTKEIISSPINSRGEKPCEFILELACS